MPKAFPTAYGAGANSDGWRTNPTVYVVTSLNDNSTTLTVGEFRHALMQTGPRIIVFNVSGVIELSASISLDNSHSNVYIAGQSSPSGIIIRDWNISSNNTNDILVRYIKFYADPTNSHGNITWQMYYPKEIIFDHCEIYYNQNEALTFWDDTNAAGSQFSSGGYTVQNTVIGEGTTGVLMGGEPYINTGDSQGTSYRNLYAHVSHRTPNFQADMLGEKINDVNYNQTQRMSNVDNSAQANFIGNYMKGGPQVPINGGLYWTNPSDLNDGLRRRNIISQNSGADVWLDPTNWNYATTLVESASDDQRVMFTRSTDTSGAAVIPNEPYSDYILTTKVALTEGVRPPEVTQLQALTDVLANVGARHYLNADGTFTEVIDTQLQAYIDDVTNTTNLAASWVSGHTLPTLSGTRPANYDTDGDGIPDVWFGVNVPSGQTATDIAPSGYLWIEEFLNSVDSVSSGNSPIITLNGDSIVNITKGNPYTEQGAIWTDTEDGTGTNVSITGTVDINTVGTYLINYDYTDSNSNNATQVTRTVNVTTDVLDNKNNINKNVIFST